MKDRRGILSTISRDDRLTGFEKKVYRAVLDIPCGEVRSYKWVAKRIARPRSYRAVGNALNKNPYTKVVSCHRVVKSDLALGGYSKGKALKEALLKSEGVDCRGGRCYNLRRARG